MDQALNKDYISYLLFRCYFFQDTLHDFSSADWLDILGTAHHYHSQIHNSYNTSSPCTLIVCLLTCLPF